MPNSDLAFSRATWLPRKRQKIRGKIKAAMFYPCAVMFVAVAILTILMVFVIPKFEAIFTDFGVALPGLHSALFIPVPEPTLRTGVKAMTSAVLELMKK